MGKRKVVLDLNGHVIESPASVGQTIKVNNPDVELVIKDSSKDKTGKVINNENSEDNGICVWARLGDVVIEGGNFENRSNYESTMYVGTTKANIDAAGGVSPTMTILDGKFTNSADGQYHWKETWKPIVLNVYNQLTTDLLQTKGGEYYEQDPSKGDDRMGGTFCADGYESVAIEGGYKVQKTEE